MIGSLLFAGVASAIDWNITGFVRQEIAYGISSHKNENNIGGDPYNDKIVGHTTHKAYNADNYNDGTSVYVSPTNGAVGLFGTGQAVGATAPTAAQIALAKQINSGFGPNYSFKTNTAETLTKAQYDAWSINVHRAGHNTNSAVNCRYGGLNAIAAGSTGLYGTNDFLGVSCGATASAAQVLGGLGSNMTTAAGFGVGGNMAGATLASADAANHADVRSVQGAGLNEDRDFNMFNTRAELDIQAKFSRNLAAFVKVRAYFDGTSWLEGSNVTGGDNFSQNKYWYNGNGSPTEMYSSDDFMLDLPAAYVDWNQGPLWLRIGNQTIAWGEAYFFRVMDVANGLDLRRHLTLGPGAEEYQDSRVASPGIRLSYTFDNGWEIDAFAQMWSPTILPGKNTPYSVVPHSVTLDEGAEFDEAEGSINYGFKLTAPLTDQFTAMFAWVNRRDPNGYVRYAEAPAYHQGANAVNKAGVGMGSAGGFSKSTANANRFCANENNDTNNLLGNIGYRGFESSYAAMPTILGGGHKTLNQCGSPLAPDPHAPNSTEYWHDVAAGRLDPVKALRVVVNEWPADWWATREMFGFGDEYTVVDAQRTIEGFHSSFGGFRAWATREFDRENVFVIGGNYVVNASADSFFDQLIIRGEVSYTHDKKMTDLGLSFEPTEKDDIVSALIFEKYHRISSAFPATYMVAQWMHRTATDMFGRDLAGNGGAKDLGAYINKTTGRFNDKARTFNGAKPVGNSNANYVVFAFQQPFPDLVWRFDMAVLVDVAGGYLVQPGIRYRPAANWQWDLYANVIESPGGDNDTITETLDYADEVFIRATYFF
jgi:hypothetical protein